MHKSNTEHSPPQVADGYKIYNINGAPFEVPSYYTLLKPLGMGAYGVVCSVLDNRDGNKYAVKKCLNVFRDLEDGKRVLREIALMRFMNNKNTMPVIDLLPPRGGRSRFKDVYVVMPLMDVDMNVVLRSRQVLEENHFQYFIYQLLCALRYLHAARVAHRDLKPSNLMTNISCELRLCDFGLSRELDNLNSTLTDYVVTRWYRPPELLLMESKYTTAVDIWSAGMIFAEFYTRRPLFPAKTTIEQLKMVCASFGKPPVTEIEDPAAVRMINSIPDCPPKSLAEVVPKLTNPQGRDFLSHMLEKDPKKRWTAEQLINHPFLEGVRDAPDQMGPLPTGAFHWEYEGKTRMTLDDLREGFWKEICNFHPEIANNNNNVRTNSSGPEGIGK